MKTISFKFVTTTLVGTALAGIVLINATAENNPSPTPAQADDKTTVDTHHWHHGWNHDMADGGRWGHERGEMKERGMWHHHNESLKGVIAGLQLTDDQKAKLEPILKSEEAQVKAIHEQAQAQIKTLISNDILQIQPVLTPEQQQIVTDKVKLQADEAALRQSEESKKDDASKK